MNTLTSPDVYDSRHKSFIEVYMYVHVYVHMLKNWIYADSLSCMTFECVLCQLGVYQCCRRVGLNVFVCTWLNRAACNLLRMHVMAACIYIYKRRVWIQASCVRACACNSMLAMCIYNLALHEDEKKCMQTAWICKLVLMRSCWWCRVHSKEPEPISDSQKKKTVLQCFFKVGAAPHRWIHNGWCHLVTCRHIEEIWKKLQVASFFFFPWQVVACILLLGEHRDRYIGMRWERT